MGQWIVAAALAAALWGADAPTSQFAPNEGLPLIRWQDAVKHVGERCIVVGKVERARSNRGGYLLQFEGEPRGGFAVFIRREHVGRFPKTPIQLYPRKWIRATGLIDEYRGKPELIVSAPEQIEVLSGEPSLPEAHAGSEWKFDGTVTVGTFNVLNLFDDVDDPYTADEGTPPKSREDMQRLADTIRKLNADVLALEEVENRGILERFVRVHLSDLHYAHVVHVESNDQRGIDCAVLSRLPVGPVTSYRHVPIPMKGGEVTTLRRDLLRVRIEPPGGDAFDVFVVHFKSKRGERTGETSPVRQAEAEFVRRTCDEILRDDAAARFIVCGDFNDTWESGPIRTIRGDGAGALACFVDELPPAQRVSYNQEPHRSVIDYIFCSPAMAKRYVGKSYTILDGSVATSGSDHNPVRATFRVRSN
ncbi:MAG: endonuclease/exonuclease/phosphatase family protein [Phycisphaerae bacterium]|nr:endonuclease/exonuclease/phosphatase family protein [Phycisphaerae bacterium]